MISACLHRPAVWFLVVERNDHCCGRYPIELSEQRPSNNFIIALSESRLGVVEASSAVPVTSGCLSRQLTERRTVRSVSCSERTSHRSAASVMDDDRHGTDERTEARKTGPSLRPSVRSPDWTGQKPPRRRPGCQ